MRGEELVFFGWPDPAGLVRWLPRSLEEALAAAEADEAVRGWFSEPVWRAYGALKRHELAAAAELSPDAVIRSYLDAY